MQICIQFLLITYLHKKGMLLMADISFENTSVNEIKLNNSSITNNTTSDTVALNIGEGNNLENILNNMQLCSKTTSTGIKELDDVLNGGVSSGIYLIAAKPGLGKTTIAISIAEAFSKSGIQVLYFCNDMRTEEVVAKGLSRTSYLIAQENGFSASAVLKHHENGLIESPIFKSTCECYKNSTLNLRIVDISGSLNFDNICKIMSDYIELKKLQPIVIIDYLQKIVVTDTNNDKEKMDFLIEQLKAFSITYSLPIIVLSSINRMSYNKELTMDSLKESGGLEYNSDVIIGIQYAGVGDPNFNIESVKSKKIWDMELVILKQRLGSADIKIPLKFYPKYNLFPYCTQVEHHNIPKTSDIIKLP